MPNETMNQTETPVKKTITAIEFAKAWSKAHKNGGSVKDVAKDLGIEVTKVHSKKKQYETVLSKAMGKNVTLPALVRTREKSIDVDLLRKEFGLELEGSENAA